MPWLKYSDDEVTRFHPEFLSAADDVLKTMGIDADYRWNRHLRSLDTQLIPDFVLVDRRTNRWALVVEIKRTRQSVYSTRNQVQAKGYSEANQTKYPIGRPHFFSVTNFEATLLFAVNGTNPPKDCRIKDMAFDSGTFTAGTAAAHRATFASHLQTIVDHVLGATTPVFESVWPRVVKAMADRAVAVPYSPIIDLNKRAVPRIVLNYFTGGNEDTAKHELLLRCLVAEYLQGVLHKYGHSGATRLPTMRNKVQQVANVIDALRRIDFSGIFEMSSASMYRSLTADRDIRDAVELYIDEVMVERISAQAQNRGDVLEFPDALTSEIYPLEIQDRRGKAQTDPDLAYLLASLTIDGATRVVLDPGCGDGSLLSAAYDVLSAAGATHSEALGRLKGIEADSLASKIAALRLVMKEPFVLASTDPNRILCGDMFSLNADFADANVVLMNPPFKRYEAQGDAPIPTELREHYRTRIESLGGSVETDVGQANIYNLYVEYVVKASGPDTMFGFILDNRWYHNRVAEALRELLLRECEVIAIVEYPHDAYFRDWTIATSLLIARKRAASSGHHVQFIRTNAPRRADFNLIAQAVRGHAAFPQDWRSNPVPQSALNKGSWKEHFSKALDNEYRASDWPTIDTLFSYSRRGSLAKEGGGIVVYEFPFNRTTYGHKRTAKPAPRNNYQTMKGRPLTRSENDLLRDAASSIPEDFLGYAIQNADQITGYEISVSDVTTDQTLETPKQRLTRVSATYFTNRRRVWDGELDAAVDELMRNPSTRDYIGSVQRLIGLDESVLPRPEIWNVLREPYAGELVIPRKLRVGHRVHINPFAYDPSQRQLRLSSNLFSYANCIAVDPSSGLTRQDSVRLISAFLLSSFGQLQFELEAYNREGARSIEQHQLERIRVFDPRWIRPGKREGIVAAASRLPYPVPTDRAPHAQPELTALDGLFADEIVNRNPSLDQIRLLDEVHQMLFDWLEARRP